MAKNWNNLTEEEKSEFRQRATDIAERAHNAKEQYNTDDEKSSIVSRILKSMFSSIERTMTNYSKRK